MDILSPQFLQGKYYVYTLAYPDGKVFYVGKGSGYRISQHEQEARRVPSLRNHKCNIIRKIWANGGQVAKHKLAYFHTEEEAFIYEMALIFLMDGLTNVTDGGEGVSGFIPSVESRKKIAEKVCKLTSQQVSEIRERTKRETLRQLAPIYGVSHETIRLIVNGITHSLE